MLKNIKVYRILDIWYVTWLDDNFPPLSIMGLLRSPLEMSWQRYASCEKTSWQMSSKKSRTRWENSTLFSNVGESLSKYWNSWLCGSCYQNDVLTYNHCSTHKYKEIFLHQTIVNGSMFCNVRFWNLKDGWRTGDLILVRVFVVRRERFGFATNLRLSTFE